MLSIVLRSIKIQYLFERLGSSALIRVEKKEAFFQINDYCQIVEQSDTQNKSSSTANYKQQNHE